MYICSPAHKYQSPHLLPHRFLSCLAGRASPGKMANSCSLPRTCLIAGNSSRSHGYARFAHVRPLSPGFHLGSSSLTCGLEGKMVPSGSRWHPCRMNSSDLTSQLEFGKKNNDKRVNGVFWILLLNLGVFVADHWFLLREIKGLYLYHARPAWFQFITATFCHGSWNHLSSNLFFLYIFGKLVEEEEGSLGLWVSYLLTGAGANLVSWLVLPRNAVSVGASGAVFGLFAISVLVKIRWDWRKILEVLILGQFVIQRVMEAAQASAAISGTGFALQNVNHIAHLSGALIGVCLIWLLNGIPSSDQENSPSSIKKN